MLTTPKKFLGCDTKCFLCSKEALKKDKIYIFGKTSVDLQDLIDFAVDVNLSGEGNPNLFVCKQTCFRALLKISEARKKLENLKSEIKTRYAGAKQGNERFKRLNKPDIDDKLVSNQEEPIRSLTDGFTERPKKVAKTLLYPTTCTSSSYSDKADTATPVASTGAVQSELGNEHSSGIYFAPKITSTPTRSSPAKQKAPEVKVVISYPSKTVRKVLNSDYESLAKALVYGEPSNIASAVMRSQELRSSVIQKVLELVAKEITGLCSRKNPSLLRKTSKSDLVSFRLQSLCEEWKARAPIFYSFLLTSSVTQSNASTSTWFPSMAIAGSVLLKQRNAQMSATAHVMGILLKSGSIESTLSRFTKLRITTSNKTVLGKLDDFGEEHDKVLLKAKNTITMENIFVKSLDKKREEAISNLNIAEASQISKDKLKLLNTCHPGFVIAFDNIDLIVKRRNTTVTEQNYDFHWINHKMVENRVSGNHLRSDQPSADILNVQNIKFLPSLTDSERQRMDYMILTSRIISNYFDILEPLRDVCIHHIPHKYTKEMSQKSNKVPLGVIFKNETINEDMLATLQQFHTYLPMKWNGEVDDQIFTGDQVTVERAVNVISSVSNGESQEERLDGINPQIGDWHAAVKLLTLIYKRFFSAKSDGDSCSLFSDRTLINQRNVTSDPKSSYRANRDFLLTVIESRVIAATMKVLGLESKTHKPHNILPEDVDTLPKSAKVNLLLELSAKVVDEFIFDKNAINNTIDSILLEQERETVRNQQQLTADGRFPCRFPGCKSSFKYNGKSRRDHELSHDPPVQITEDGPTIVPSKPTEKSELSNKDDMYDYNCALLADGFLFKNFLDAIKEGDGERMMRQYKYMLLYCRADGTGSTKYSLECLYQFFLVHALLTPRDSERYVWNRFVNNHAKIGTNIALDLDVEHSNNYLKGAIKNLGPNISEKAVTRIANAESHSRAVLSNVDSSLQYVQSSGKHGACSILKNVEVLVKRINEENVFTFDGERKYMHFLNFQRNRLDGLDMSDMFKWINKHKKYVSLGIRAR